MRWWPRKQVYVDDLPRTHDIRFAALFILLVVTLLGSVYAVGFFVAGDRLPRGTTVSGIDVGGMHRAEAKSELQDQLFPRLDTVITATALGKEFNIDPQRAGMTFDVEATLKAVLEGERWDPRHMLKVVMGGSAQPAVVDIDYAELDATLERISHRIGQPPVDATVSFAARSPAITEGVEGVALDFSAASDALQDALVEGDDEIELPVVSVEPDITQTEALEFVDRIAEPAMAAPVRIRIADVTRTLRPALFVRALRAVADGGELTLALNEGVLMQRSRSVLASLPHHPVNAAIVFRDGQPAVKPSQSGVSVARDDWAAAVLKAVARKGSDRIASAVVTPNQPALSTQEARALRIERVVASSELRVSGADPVAVAAAVRRLDGVLVRPRGSFSFLQRVGAGDAAAASIVASAAYDAAFRAGMSDIARTAPRVLMRGAQPGLDAAAEPGTDLAWVNKTPFGVYIRAVVDANGQGPDFVRLQLWSSPYWTVDVSSSGRYNVVAPDVQRQSGGGCRPRAGVPGFEIDVSRSFSRAGEGQRTESTHSRYAAVDAIVCRR